jgi:5'-3' exonuclease
VPAPLLTADVPWLLYRSFFALPSSITDPRGRPVNALLGTVNAILSVTEVRPPAQPPRCVVACMGAEEAAYRVQLYAGYHAHRDPMPAELAEQWRRAPELLESLGWVLAGDDALEADDVMFSYARAEEESGGEARLLTGDRDLYAAVSDRVAVLDLKKQNELGQIGPAQVRERYGVDPQAVPDFIALRGDPSDGLPGAPGVGAKTAAELLGAHGSLEALLLAAETALAAPLPDLACKQAGIRPRIAAALAEHAEQLRAFKLIATLQRIDVTPPPDRPTDYATGASTASAMGMKRLGERLAGLAGGASR